MGNSRLVPGKWIKSSRSQHPQNECVEAMLTDDGIAVRDSKNPVASLSTTAAGWQALLTSLQK